MLKDFQKRGEEMNNSIFKISYFYFYYCYENVNFLRESSLNEHSQSPFPKPINNDLTCMKNRVPVHFKIKFMAPI